MNLIQEKFSRYFGSETIQVVSSKFRSSGESIFTSQCDKGPNGGFRDLGPVQKRHSLYE